MSRNYEKKIISNYLCNLVMKTGRTSPVANVIRESIDDGDLSALINTIIPDDSEFSDRKSRRARRRRPVPPEIWAEIISSLSDFSKNCRRARPSVFDKNLSALSEHFDCDPIEHQILDFLFRYEDVSDFGRLFCEIIETRSVDVIEFISRCLGHQPHEITRRLSKNCRLLSNGLITISDYSLPFEVPDRIIKCLAPPNRSFEDVSRSLIGAPVKSTLEWSDFDHVASERDLIADLLEGSLRHKRQGINVLVYGPPGTGKTEFCKTVAAKLNSPLYAIGESDDEGSEPDRAHRLSQVRISQRLLQNQQNTLLIFDEMEDLLGDGSSALWSLFGLSRRDSGSSGGSKVFVNRLLEENPTPVFWTCNDISGFDPAHLRRMTMAVEIKTPPPRVRERVWRRILDRHQMSLPDDEIKSLAVQFDAAPGLAEGAVKAAKLTGGGVENMRLTTGAIAKALRGGTEAPPKVVPTSSYDPNLSNMGDQLSGLERSLASSASPKNFSLCLYGPPGTGKSAYVRHLAESMGMELLFKRASDLLSKWVGGTEQNIAEAFSEARSNGCFLLFDEADSLLQDRARAERSWELTQVNEMLTWMEVHDYPFACTTNLFESLDKASLRRFTFKVPFNYLKREQAAYAFEHFFGCAPPQSLSSLDVLTPGDFDVVKRKANFLGALDDPRALVALLREECEVKPEFKRAIGFGGR